MAEAPRRRGRDREPGDKPPAARPVKPGRPARERTPPVAKPVQPVAKPVGRPVAKPVGKPVAKPVGRPVQPGAKPVAKPVARPAARAVAPVAPPVAREAAPPASGGSGRRPTRQRMDEEDIGRTGRRGRPRAGHHGGMGLGAKAALLTGLVTFLAIGIAILLSGSQGPSGEEEAKNAFGFAACGALAAPDARWWRGAGTVRKQDLGYFAEKFEQILGKEGAEFWAERIKLLTQPPPRDMSPFAQEELQREQERFNKALAKLDRGGSGEPKNVVQARLAHVWRTMNLSDRDRFQISAAWLRDDEGATEGKWLAGSVSASEAAYDWAQHAEYGKGFGYVDGKVSGTPVRIFTTRIAGLGKAADPLIGYVAVYERPSSSGGSPLGMLMLILGPLMVAFTAYGIANAHTKNVRNLAREIDRLGSAGDPTRELRAHGAEATTMARSIERMVANLDFRAKHEGADLDEVVSREQKIAEEIHGTLISKNPPRLSNFEVETLFKPGFEIGGDHFEYFPIDDDHLGIILLDTNVRGIPAALVMSAAKSYVRAAAPGELSPAAVLRRVNRLLSGDLPPGRHVTALYVVLNIPDGTATMASAGHLPLLVYRHAGGKMAKVNPEGIALGLDSGVVFDRTLQEGDIPIGVGDRIVLYTDGALKIQNAEGEEFGEQRFYGTVTNEAPKNSQAFVNFVGSAIDRFHLEVPQNDDITISTVKRLR